MPSLLIFKLTITTFLLLVVSVLTSQFCSSARLYRFSIRLAAVLGIVSIGLAIVGLWSL